MRLFLKSVFNVLVPGGVFFCCAPTGDDEYFQKPPDFFNIKEKIVWTAFWKMEDLLKICDEIGFEPVYSNDYGSMLSIMLKRPKLKD